MEDIDCQSEQHIAPNKLQMFCMHSCSIYLFMCINFKKKAVKNVSVLALSLQSFICLHAVQCCFCIFFPSVFSIFFFPADSAAGMKAASGSGVAQCFRWPMFFFFFVSCSFEAYLHHCWKSSVLTCDAHEAEHGHKWAKMADGSLRWFLISLKVPKTETQIAGEDVSTRGSSAPAPMMMCTGGSPFWSPASISGPLILLSPPLSGCQSHRGGRWLAAVDFSS